MNDRDLPPERIGPYRLEARLGRGGMGEVFLAFDERLERRVAIKRLRWQPGTTEGAAERFRREARAVARLNHPAIVQIYDLISGDGEGDAIVMEYVLGRPLASLIGDPTLTPALAVHLAREIAQGPSLPTVSGRTLPPPPPPEPSGPEGAHLSPAFAVSCALTTQEIPPCPKDPRSKPRSCTRRFTRSWRRRAGTSSSGSP